MEVSHVTSPASLSSDSVKRTVLRLDDGDSAALNSEGSTAVSAGDTSATSTATPRGVRDHTLRCDAVAAKERLGDKDAVEKGAAAAYTTVPLVEATDTAKV